MLAGGAKMSRSASPSAKPSGCRCVAGGELHQPAELGALQVIVLGTVGNVTQGVAQARQAPYLFVERICAQMQFGARNPGRPLSGEHRLDVGKRETGELPERDQGELGHGRRVELASQAVPRHRADETDFLIVAQRRGGQAAEL